VSEARAFVRFSPKVTRSSFGVTAGGFLFWFVFSLPVQRKNEQASSLAKQITKDKIQYNRRYNRRYNSKYNINPPHNNLHQFNNNPPKPSNSQQKNTFIIINPILNRNYTLLYRARKSIYITGSSKNKLKIKE